MRQPGREPISPRSRCQTPAQRSLAAITLHLHQLAALAFSGAGIRLEARRTLISEEANDIVISLAIYLILDMELPRVGLIHTTATDQVLLDLAQSLRAIDHGRSFPAEIEL